MTLLAWGAMALHDETHQHRNQHRVLLAKAARRGHLPPRVGDVLREAPANPVTQI